MNDDDRDEMYKPLSPEELKAGEQNTSDDSGVAYEPLVPVPETAPTPEWNKLRPKEATGDPLIYPYHTPEGAFAFYVARWKPEDKDPNDSKKKIIRPVTFDGKQWWLKAMPEPWPLYNLPKLLAAPVDYQIYVVEGEKCTNALAEELNKIKKIKIVPTTWSGGAHNWDKTDWTRFAERRFVLIADADKTGRDAMKKLAAHLCDLRCEVRIYLPEGDAGDDIYDWIAADGLKTTLKDIKDGTVDFDPVVHAVTDQGGAQNADDWQTELVARVRGDKDSDIDPDLGAPFEPDILEKITALKRDQPADWQRLRAKLKGVGILVGPLDLEIAKASPGSSANRQGEPILFEETEPWDDPVDGAALLDEGEACIEHYVDMPEGGAAAVAVWTLYTFVFDAFLVTPYLMVTVPERESGKTRVTEIASYMVYRQLMVSDISAAAIFRVITEYQPTLLFDEAQQFLNRKPDDPARGLLRSASSLRSAKAIRCEGDANDIRLFSTFSPKMMNGRNLVGMDDMLTSRSVVIPMTRATHEMPDLRADKDPVGLDYRRKCLRWALDSMELLRDAEPDMGDLKNRDADRWRPLFTVADAAGGDWPQKIRSAMKALAEATAKVSPGDTLGVELLKDCLRVFREARNPETIQSSALDEKLRLNS